MRLTLRELRVIVRNSLTEFAVGATVSISDDPTKIDPPPTLDLEKDVQRAHTGFYPYEIERGVPLRDDDTIPALNPGSVKLGP